MCLHSLNVKQFYFIDRAPTGVTTPGQSGPGSNGNEGVLHIPQIFKAEASPSDCFMSYPRQLLGGFYPSTEMQSVYSTAPVDWAETFLDILIYIKINKLVLGYILISV